MPEETEFRSRRADADSNFDGALVSAFLSLQAIVVRDCKHHPRAKSVPIDAAHSRDRQQNRSGEGRLYT